MRHLRHYRHAGAATAHVGTAALGCPVERSSTPVHAISNPGCPTLARSLRKGGNSHRWRYGILAVTAMAITLFSGCRLDMHVQPKQNPLARSTFFPDQRSERPPVEGTVARGQLHADTYFYTGKIGSEPGDYMPFPVTRAVLERGRERYNIYCSPCHSLVGDGNGFVPSRGFSRMPPSYHIPRLQKAPLGYFFDVITNGFGIMPDYRSQIAPEDRWKIVAYVRALQLSQNATQADVPAGQAVPSQPPQLQLGSGATPPVVETSTPVSAEEHP